MAYYPTVFGHRHVRSHTKQFPKGKGHPRAGQEILTYRYNTNLDPRWVVCGQRHVPNALTPEKENCIYRTGVWDRPVWEMTTPTGIRSPDRLARSKSLYRLSYPGPQHNSKCKASGFYSVGPDSEPGRDIDISE